MFKPSNFTLRLIPCFLSHLQVVTVREVIFQKLQCLFTHCLHISYTFLTHLKMCKQCMKYLHIVYTFRILQGFILRTDQYYQQRKYTYTALKEAENNTWQRSRRKRKEN